MSVLNTSVPSDAIATYFAAANGKKGTYWTWQVGRDWYWFALANTGFGATEQEVREAAKRWIRDCE